MRTIKYAVTAMILAVMAASGVYAQTSDKYHGSVVSFGSGMNTRMRTSTFDLIINGVTPKDDADGLMKVLDEKGPDHSKCFQISAVVGERTFAAAWGPSKKIAEQRAAHNALSELDGDAPPHETG